MGRMGSMEMISKILKDQREKNTFQYVIYLWVYVLLVFIVGLNPEKHPQIHCC
jgi:hypothetical protein